MPVGDHLPGDQPPVCKAHEGLPMIAFAPAAVCLVVGVLLALIIVLSA